MKAVLLPGMDGTGELFAPLLQTGLDADVHRYPADQPLGYDALEARIRESLPDEPFIVVAESFSGPLGVRLAADPPEGMQQLVLVASFVTSPTALRLPGPLARAVFSVTPPTAVLRRILLDAHCSEALVQATRRAIARVDARVMAARLRSILEVDEREALVRSRVPLRYLRATRDRLVGSEALATIRTLRPDVEVVEIPGPHLLLQARPATCLPHVS